MVKTIVPGFNEQHLGEAVRRLRDARSVAALTGAGISVESGIPDFRSADGLWQEFPPDEYATIDAFLHDPEKAWRLYRAIGEILRKAKPNPAHAALAAMERAGLLQGIVTQNIDGLHQAAGSSRVIEIHGDHRHLQCLGCGRLEPLQESTLDIGAPPRCAACNRTMKPNVVLFGEAVRDMDEIGHLLEECDLLLVVGTSALVYPAAGLPAMVKQHGGLIYELNQEHTALTGGETGLGLLGSLLQPSGKSTTDFFFDGRAGASLPLLVRHLGI